MSQHFLEGINTRWKDTFAKRIQEPLVSHSLVFLTGLVLLFGLYHTTLFKLVHKYMNSGTYAHGFLILPISLWMIVQHRARFSFNPLKFEPLGLVFILILSMVWFVAALAFVGIIQQLSFVLLIIALFISCYGFRASVQFAFPLAYLLFAIPFGNFLTPSLQDLTAQFTVFALELSGIPVFFEGWLITTSQGEFEVAEACSGIRYLIATLSLGTLFAYYTYQRTWKRLVFLALCIVVPLAANAARAYTIVWIAHKSNMKYAVGIDHLIYGWIFFGVIIGLLFYIGSLWRDPPPNPQPLQVIEGAPTSHHSFMIPLLAIALLLGPLFSFVAKGTAPTDMSIPLNFVEGTKGWSGPIVSETSWSPQFIQPTKSRLSRYVKDDMSVDVFVALYYQQNPDSELLTESNRIYQHESWALLDRALYAFKSRTLPTVVEHAIQNKEQKRLIWSWYNIAGTHTTSPIWGKVLEGYSMVRKGNEPSMVIAVSTPFEYYSEQGRSKLEEFIEDMGPVFMQGLLKDE